MVKTVLLCISLSRSSTPEEFGALMATESERMARIVKLSGAKVE